MIGKGHPQAPENLKALRKSGAVLFFATDSNLLWAREGENWVNLGHVVPLGGGRMNQAIHPRLEGVPYSQGPRLQGIAQIRLRAGCFASQLAFRRRPLAGKGRRTRTRVSYPILSVQFDRGS